MLVLAIETATNHSSVVLADDDRELASWREVTRQDLCQRLALEVSRVLEKAEKRFGDLQLVAAGLGPGSFTSVRVGLATAKGIALARDIPLVGVSSLEAMVWQTRGRLAGVVCAVIDAKRGELYASSYRVERGRLEQVERESVATAADLVARLASLGQPAVVIGEPEQLSRQDVERFGHILRRPAAWPDAAAIAELGLRRYNARGEDEIGPLRPIYVRMSYAEESRKIDLGLR